ncbi:hypothetical protein T492DRAFT_845940 [Pavlovales sp. CCMP2436]|nr:hypothetical protein T492DRAFT_845940 [Pavlovales sp. CCMP2436]
MPVLGFRFNELPPLFIAAPPPTPGLEALRSIPGAAIPFGVGREVTFKARGALPAYATLELRLVDEADGRLVGEGAVRLPTRTPDELRAGGEDAPAFPAFIAAPAFPAFIECRLTAEPTPPLSRTAAAIAAAAAAAAASTFDGMPARGAEAAAAAAAAGSHLGSQGESVLLRFHWQLLPDSLAGLPDQSGVPGELLSGAPVASGAYGIPDAPGSPPGAEVPGQAGGGVAAVELSSIATVELAVPVVHLHTGAVHIYNADTGGRHGADNGGALSVRSALSDGRTGGTLLAGGQFGREVGRESGREAALAGLVPGVLSLRAGTGLPAGLLPDSSDSHA